jgi:hypothetical protein
LKVAVVADALDGDEEDVFAEIENFAALVLATLRRQGKSSMRISISAQRDAR